MLKIHNASVFFKGPRNAPVKALDRITLDIADGEIVVALGTSGCGKSTLLNAIAGFLPLSQGTITLRGRAIEGPGADRGVVFQKDTLLPWKSVIDNVALGLDFSGLGKAQARSRARDLLRLVGLQDFEASPPYELSGGMRQRVGIARALATDPAILLMDEPFGALDSFTREQMHDLLISLWTKTGKTIFLITHSIEEALSLGTRVLVMSPRPGRIVARYETAFVHRLAADGDRAVLEADLDFIRLRNEIRALIHRSGPQPAHAPEAIAHV
ncbi:taurine ABC transporter ATP-binding protein [Methylovirgula sp. 4M-Z18]|uniref:taurine ABC transporter ATP-binding protein n=1 Tax=Methylovirgula sp. 4M-Z18 TaxID=2293567 RepID=UPI000E2FADAC|nr:ABC transporter ATP-binding protein [Methylovirgula sp. 4M-Z18]RFB78612.1 ABC transporter ATP-binding protein [Methylovirgula sp. 4M-Z18]